MSATGFQARRRAIEEAKKAAVETAKDEKAEAKEKLKADKKAAKEAAHAAEDELGKMTVAALKEKADGLNIATKGLKKADLVAAILEATKPAEPDDDAE